ncbi:MAG: HepT-like ribonuclease domain-containing protein [Rhodomicrobium sp.]
MPSEDTQQAALFDIRDNILFAQGLVSGMPYEAFRDNRIVFYAATRCLEIISEASRRLGPEIQGRQAHIAWRKIAAAGNIYRHNYEDVQQKLVWSTIHDDLPSLLSAVQTEIAPQ